MITPGVYKIECSVDNKIYIGSSGNTEKRLEKHKSQLKNNHHPNTHLQRAYNKHGKESFTFGLFEATVDRREGLIREQYYLDTLLHAQEFIKKEDNKFKELGYNINPKATSTAGREITDETRQKMRYANSGERNGMFGKKLSKESIEKGWKSRRLKWEEAKMKMSRTKLGKPLNANGKPIECSDYLTGNKIIFVSISEAERTLEINKGTLVTAILGGRGVKKYPHLKFEVCK